MTITLHFYEEGSSMSLFIEGAAEVAAFKELVQRGSNIAPDAPASMKILADLVTNGKVMQDYEVQELKPELRKKQD